MSANSLIKNRGPPEYARIRVVFGSGCLATPNAPPSKLGPTGLTKTIVGNYMSDLRITILRNVRECLGL